MMVLQNVHLNLALYQSDEETLDHVAVDDFQDKIARWLSLAALSFSVESSIKYARKRVWEISAIARIWQQTHLSESHMG